MPTELQTLSCFIACQTLTTMYLPIYLVRFDERIDEIFILAGDNIQILIDRNGDRRFIE
ncbi:DUF6888 family protein [Geminocystis herdmanii]|uniref:DUF6888 family protein n=1 Tax=Geminocystis herdmanii TaxID=669359 RepID=UPI0036F30D4C